MSQLKEIPQADWGVYNSIYSGSTATNGWRTLTREEWAYVFQGRSGASSKYGHGKVNGQNGMILLPPRSPEFAIREARIPAFAMRKNNDMRLPWYFDELSNHTTALQGRL